MRISDWSSDVCSSDLGGGCSYHWHGDQGHWPRWRRGGRLGHLPRKWFTDDAIACLAGAAGHLPLASRRARRHAAAALHAAGDAGTPPVLRRTDIAPWESSEERRVGNEGDSTCHIRWATEH